ncbi:MAG: DUF3794 domain-containing protein [Bacillota bacterium]|nr:DUF3794 domain-containing protein [Bacillota bacterium]
MSVELIKESVRVFQAIGDELAQTIFENDIIVPDTKPDVAHILLLDGNTFIKSAEVLQDTVQINGGINYKILYIPDEPDQSIKSINTSSSFSQEIDVPGARTGMKCVLKPDIEHIDFNILNGRKINTKAIVKMNIKVTDEIEIGVVNGLRGLDNVQEQKETVNINCCTGMGDATYVANESLEVPAGKPTIREILRNDVKITGKECKPADNKVIVKGDLNLSTLYLPEDESQGIQYMEHEIPFSQLVDLNGADEDSVCDVQCEIADSNIVPAEDSDGELRNLNTEITLKLNVSGYSRKAFDIISDAFGPRMRLDFEKESFRLEEVVAENRSQIILKDTITTDGETPGISEVFNVLCKPVLSDYSVTDNKIVLEGAVKDSILYLSNTAEQPISCCEQEVLFRHGIDIKGIKPDMKCDVDLAVEHCNYSMVSSTEVEVRLVIGVSVKVVKEYSLPLISKVTEHPTDDKRAAAAPSITLYFPQQGDTLWKIAKKYCIPMQDIQKVNNLDEDELNEGQQIIIPRALL